MRETMVYEFLFFLGFALQVTSFGGLGQALRSARATTNVQSHLEVIYTGTPVTKTLRIVPLTEDDIPTCAGLVVEGFDMNGGGGGGPWWRGLGRMLSLWSVEAEMEHRFFTYCVGAGKVRPHHLMACAKGPDNVPVAYIELGLVPFDELEEPKHSIAEHIARGTAVPHIGNVVVAAPYRRQGVAKALMLHVIDECKRWGYSHIYCAVEDDNPAARQLYVDKLGFEAFREEKAAPGKGVPKDRTVLRKALAPPAAVAAAAAGDDEENRSVVSAGEGEGVGAAEQEQVPAARVRDAVGGDR